MKLTVHQRIERILKRGGHIEGIVHTVDGHIIYYLADGEDLEEVEDWDDGPSLA